MQDGSGNGTGPGAQTDSRRDFRLGEQYRDSGKEEPLAEESLFCEKDVAAEKQCS